MYNICIIYIYNVRIYIYIIYKNVSIFSEFITDKKNIQKFYSKFSSFCY